MENKKLYKDEKNKKLSGVCAGIARYFGIDVTVIRLVWVLVTIFASCFFGGIIAYIICACVMSEEPAGYTTYEQAPPYNNNSQQL